MYDSAQAILRELLYSLAEGQTAAAAEACYNLANWLETDSTDPPTVEQLEDSDGDVVFRV